MPAPTLAFYKMMDAGYLVTYGKFYFSCSRQDWMYSSTEWLYNNIPDSIQCAMIDDSWSFARIDRYTHPHTLMSVKCHITTSREQQMHMGCG